jgi:hypothetical protein
MKHLAAHRYADRSLMHGIVCTAKMQIAAAKGMERDDVREKLRHSDALFILYPLQRFLLTKH